MSSSDSDEPLAVLKAQKSVVRATSDGSSSDEPLSSLAQKKSTKSKADGRRKTGGRRSEKRPKYSSESDSYQSKKPSSKRKKALKATNGSLKAKTKSVPRESDESPVKSKQKVKSLLIASSDDSDDQSDVEQTSKSTTVLANVTNVKSSGNSSDSDAPKSTHKLNTCASSSSKCEAAASDDVSAGLSSGAQPRTETLTTVNSHKQPAREDNASSDSVLSDASSNSETPIDSKSNEKEEEPSVSTLAGARKVDDEDSSDTSIEDKDGPITPKKQQKSKTYGKNKTEKESKSKKDAEHPRIVKLKRYVRTAGLRCNYKQMFENINKDKERIKKLEQFLRDKGIEGTLTLEVCKTFKLKKEQERELADLNTSGIDLNEGRSLRSQAPRSRRRARAHSSSDSDDFMKQRGSSEKKINAGDNDHSEGSDSAAEEARKECQHMLSRLKGIIDSEGDSSS